MELARVYDILTLEDCFKRGSILEYLNIVEDKLEKEINKKKIEIPNVIVDPFHGETLYPCSDFVLIANTGNQAVKVQTYDQSDHIRAISYMNYILQPGHTAKLRAHGEQFIFAWFTWQNVMETPELGKKYIWNGARLVEAWGNKE